jgi:gliding motility-associated-like protein
VYRSVDGGSFDLLSTTASNDYTDTDVTNATQFSYCYEVIPRDDCGNENEENVIACAFTPTGFINDQDEVSLNWPGYTGFLNGIDRYEVEKSYDGVNFTPVSQVNDTTFFETDSQTQNQVLYYRIKVYSVTAGAVEAESYTIMLVKSNRLFFPDAFTPDGDGLNDEFTANARFYSAFEMDIFNRWGELIFHADNIDQAWDGSYNGKPVQQDTYVVKIKLTDESGTSTTHEGSLRLLR